MRRLLGLISGIVLLGAFFQGAQVDVHALRGEELKAECLSESGVREPIRLTIGIPIYNGERVIRETLDSIIAQIDEGFEQVCELEILICDNCSTDRTSDIISQEYMARFPEINFHYVCNEENVGATQNIRRVLDQAQGDYVWLFGDDVFGEDALRSLLASIDSCSEPGVIIAVSDVYCNELRECLLERSKEHQDEPVVHCRSIEELLDHGRESVYFLSSVILRMSDVEPLLELVDFDAYCPHTELVFRIGSERESVVIKGGLVKERSGSWSNTMCPKKQMDIAFDMLEMLWRYLPEKVVRGSRICEFASNTIFEFMERLHERLSFEQKLAVGEKLMEIWSEGKLAGDSLILSSFKRLFEL